MIKAILFDFDGTLVDSTEVIWRQYLQVSEKMGLQPPDRNLFIESLGLPWMEVLERLWPGLNAEEFTRLYSLDAEALKPVPGSIRFLEHLMGNYTLGLLTSRSHRTLKQKMDSCGFKEENFSIILTLDEIEYSKPDPRALLHACEKMGLKPVEVLYVGDSVVDAQCARDANIRFIGVLSGKTTIEKFLKFKGVNVIESVVDLPQILKEK
ncbi:HAD family hydrolase [Candidatus Altiarchaeota archaeon]